MLDFIMDGAAGGSEGYNLDEKGKAMGYPNLSVDRNLMDIQFCVSKLWQN